jgi:hypothetical protein
LTKILQALDHLVDGWSTIAVRVAALTDNVVHFIRTTCRLSQQHALLHHVCHLVTMVKVCIIIIVANQRWERLSLHQ